MGEVEQTVNTADRAGAGSVDGDGEGAAGAGLGTGQEQDMGPRHEGRGR